MKVHQPNSRIRLISSHDVHEPSAVFSRLMDHYRRGELKRSFDQEWEDGSYRFGGDWLTGQAFDLINLEGLDAEDLETKLQQFETTNIDRCLGWSKGLAFGLYLKDKPKYSPAIPVMIHKCGFVYSGTSIVLVWVDISLDSSSPEAWLDFLSVLKKRESRGYLKHFMDPDGVRCTHSDLVFQIEQYFFGKDAPSVIKHSSRNLQRFARFKLLTDSDEEAIDFLRATIGNPTISNAQNQNFSDYKKDNGAADIRWAWQSDTVSGILIQRPEKPAEKGANQLQNSFNFADQWLTHVICMLQFHLLNSLERDLLRALASLPKIRRARNSLMAFMQIVGMKRRYEGMMDSFMDSYWRLGLIQIHSHEKRHELFQGLRSKLGLDETVSRFNIKISTLGSFLSEKQKDILGWFLIYVPFTSLIIGLLSINVRGLTSDEGLSLAALARILVIVTATYVVAIAATRIIFAKRKSKSL